VHRSRLATRIATMGAALAAVTALAAGASPIAAAQYAAVTAPKAYVGLFGDNAVAVIDTARNQVTKTIPIPTGPHGLVITPDNKWVYASSDGDSVVSVINTATDEVTATIDAGTMPHGLAITPDGSRVLVAGFGTDQVEAIDTTTNQMVWQVPVPQPHNLAITADGQTVYAASQKAGAEALAIIDIPTGTETGSVPVDHTPRALNVSPDGAEGPGELDLFDPDSYAATGTVKVGTMPHWIAATSDNHFAYVTNEKSNDVSVVDLTSNSVKTTIPVGSAPRKIVVQSGAVPV